MRSRFFSLKKWKREVDIAVAVPALSVMGSDLLICATDDFVILMSNAIICLEFVSCLTNLNLNLHRTACMRNMIYTI